MEETNDGMSHAQFTHPSSNYDTGDCDYQLKFMYDIQRKISRLMRKKIFEAGVAHINRKNANILRALAKDVNITRLLL